MFEEAASKFAFAIGDMVAHKSQPTRAWVVGGRILHECHGGVQREYRCCTIAPNGPASHDFNESELEKFGATA